jgi:hypothetical protein
MKPLGGKRTRVLDVEIYDRPRATAEKELTKKNIFESCLGYICRASRLSKSRKKERKKERKRKN